MNKPIRHLSASNKSLVAAGAFEKDVEVWDTEARVKGQCISTVVLPLISA